MYYKVVVQFYPSGKIFKPCIFLLFALSLKQRKIGDKNRDNIKPEHKRIWWNAGQREGNKDEFEA